MKRRLLALSCYLALPTCYALSNTDYCATSQAWAAQITVAKLRNEHFDPQPLPKVELLSQQRLSGTHGLRASKDFGELYSQTLLITVTSQRPKQAAKHFIVSSIISDQECSMSEPIIIDRSLLGEDRP